MSSNSRMVVGLLILSLGAFGQNAAAQWGSRAAKTSDGTAQMNLGEYKGLKHAIGCREFENQAGWNGSWELGNNLAIMLESALRDTGRFVLVEREKLTDVIAEQDLAASGRTAGGKKVAQTGKLRSARYIGTGAVTEVTESQSGTDGGISIRGIRLGGGKKEAQIAVIVKLIDTTTGEIAAMQRIVGKAGSTALRVGLSTSLLDTELGGFSKTPLGQAAQDCINKAAELIAKKMEEFPFEGSVVKVSGNGQVIVNRGAEFGMQVGQELVMSERGEMLIDDDTGELLGEEEGEEIGVLRVAKVQEKVSYCDVVSGEQEPEAGTVVRAK